MEHKKMKKFTVGCFYLAHAWANYEATRKYKCVDRTENTATFERFFFSPFTGEKVVTEHKTLNIIIKDGNEQAEGAELYGATVEA